MTVDSQGHLGYHALEGEIDLKELKKVGFGAEASNLAMEAQDPPTLMVVMVAPPLFCRGESGVDNGLNRSDLNPNF
jgi:hypothetical protein